MLFSSTVFIFLFLPIVLGLHFLIARNYRNLFILIASLFFYAWGEHMLVLLMMGSICVNYILGNIVSEFQEKERPMQAKAALILGVAINLSVLGYYKYIHFLIDTLSQIGLNLDIDVSNVTLPIGISFFTFQSISYLIDVYRKTVVGQKSLINLGMYISLFPQLIAGPIVRYADISKEIVNRNISSSLFKIGITRFIGGFAKKILIANNVGLIADQVFAIAPSELSTSLSWIGIICYSLQIYYDFSGYSDMAIGLGKILGFNFKENFEHPYISKSIREFWRRWHISFSTWIRDYLYIPLGGSRGGEGTRLKASYGAMLISGLWHGASWTLVLWGAYHATLLAGYKYIGKWIPREIRKANWMAPFSVSLMFLFTVAGWMIFRETSIGRIGYYLSLSPLEGTPEQWLAASLMLGITLLSAIPLIIALIIEKFLVPKIENKPLFLPLQTTSWAILLCGILLMKRDISQDFIYFQF